MSDSIRLSSDAAAHVLRRAAELDSARAETISVETLRAAALEAGISGSAFDAAMTERYHPTTPTHRVRSHGRRWIVQVGVIVGVVLGLFAVLWEQRRESPAEVTITVPASQSPR